MGSADKIDLMIDNIEHKRILNNRQVIAIVMFCIMATFSLTLIYARFVQQEEEMQVLKDRIEYVNDRVSRKLK